MALKFFKSLFNFFDPFYCDCCDLYSSPVGSEVEVEIRPTKKSLRAWFSTLGRETETSHGSRTTDTRMSNKQRFMKYFSLGRRRKQGVKSSLRAHGAAHDISVVDEDLNKCAVGRLLDAMFADIIASDSILESQMDATTQCFLVHIVSDMDPDGSFLTQYQHLPAHVVGSVLDDGLGFASTWLQTSLEKIKTKCVSGGTRLQMPFCMLDTDYVAACARAFTMQLDNPEEKVAIATLDIVALKTARLIASAEHTFDFLRVPREGVELGNRLLVWTESGNDGRPAQALREAVLTVVEWEERDDKEKTEKAEGGAGDGTCNSTRADRPKPLKKDSAVTRDTTLEEGSRTGRLYLGDFSRRADSI